MGQLRHVRSLSDNLILLLCARDRCSCTSAVCALQPLRLLLAWAHQCKQRRKAHLRVRQNGLHVQSDYGALYFRFKQGRGPLTRVCSVRMQFYHVPCGTRTCRFQYECTYRLDTPIDGQRGGFDRRTDAAVTRSKRSRCFGVE